MSANGQYHLLNTRQMTSAREMRRFKRAKVIKELRLKQGDPLARQRPDFVESEFNMADESRDWQLNIGPCPQCGVSNSSILNVEHIGPKALYQLYCNNEHCTFKTPEFPLSKLAVRHWKLVAALSK